MDLGALFRAERIPLRPTEHLQYSGLCSYIKHFLFKVGGSLYLTNERLVFMEKRYFAPSEVAVDIELDDIVDVSILYSFIVVGTFRVIANGRKYSFYVSGVRGWVDAIEMARSAPPPTPSSRYDY